MQLPPVLSIRNATVSYAKKVLFENLNLNIFPNDRICLIGKNGAGKTSLMNLIAGLIDSDCGERWVKPSCNIGYLTQNNELPIGLKISEFLSEDLLLNEDKNYLIDIVCSSLNIDKEAKTDKLSGGQAKRVCLARALICEPEILLLDEPTNHLDLETIEWLENYLRGFNGALMLISHDRTFLEKVSNRVFWIRAGQLKINNNGYKNFDAWSQTISNQEQREFENLAKKVEHESGWLQTGVTARRKRNIGRLHHLNDLRDKLEAQKKIIFSGQNSIKITSHSFEEESPQVIMNFNNVFLSAKSLDNSSKNLTQTSSQDLILFNEFSLRILRGERIGVVGRNGVGKSSLLKMMVGEISSQKGTVKPARDIKISYFDQNRSAIKPDMSLQEILCGEGGEYVHLGNGKTRHICGYLKDFMFDPQDTKTLAKTLSGGQQNRLLLAKTLASPGNFMILDEPTNDLDMDSLDILQQYLADYSGTLIVVSHDRNFLDNVATSILAFEGNGIIKQSLGGYSDYIEKYKPKVKEQKNSEKSESSSAAGASKASIVESNKKKNDGIAENKPKSPYKVKIELEKLTQKIIDLEEKIQNLSLELSSTEERNPANLAQISIEIAKYQDDLKQAENRWLELA